MQDEVMEVIDTEEQVKEICEILAKQNSFKYNLSKASEECSELNLVLLQTLNKKGKHVPNIQEVIDEIGDVFLRVHILMIAMGISDEVVRQRVYKKATKYASWLKSGDYKGGI